MDLSKNRQFAIMGCVCICIAVVDSYLTVRLLSALKLRYLLPLVVPSTPSRPDHIPRTASPARAHSRGVSPARSPSIHPVSLSAPDAPPSPSPMKTRSATAEPPIIFDPRLVARKDDGWEIMLETAVLRWVKAVVEETRGESSR